MSAQQDNTEDMNGKVVVITGANTGVGYETALDLAKKNARVIIACRDKNRALEALEKLKTESKNENVEFEQLDLGDFSSVRDFATRINSKYSRLDVLINNAGISICPYWKTKEGFELQFGVNHLGHFLLTNLLLDLLKRSAPSRIINVSSRAHKYGVINWDDINSEKNYAAFKAYSQSKLANVLFTIELAQRLKGTNVTAVSVHPGYVRTEIERNITLVYPVMGFLYKLAYPIKWFLSKDPKTGAQTTIYCATSKDIPKMPGAYFNNSKKEELSATASNLDDAKRLWDLSETLVSLK